MTEPTPLSLLLKYVIVAMAFSDRRWSVMLRRLMNHFNSRRRPTGDFKLRLVDFLHARLVEGILFR